MYVCARGSMPVSVISPPPHTHTNTSNGLYARCACQQHLLVHNLHVVHWSAWLHVSVCLCLFACVRVYLNDIVCDVFMCAHLCMRVYTRVGAWIYVCACVCAQKLTYIRFMCTKITNNCGYVGFLRGPEHQHLCLHIYHMNVCPLWILGNHLSTKKKNENFLKLSDF